MNSIDKKQPDIRYWIRISDPEIISKISEELHSWKTQSDCFLHILRVYFKKNRKYK
jgi:hypothetical protein